MMTRRSFARLAAAAFATDRLDLGIGTFSYHSLSIDAMIERLSALRVKEIEMSRGEFMLMKPPTPGMCVTARKQFDRAGIECVSYYTATIKTNQDIDYAVKFAKLLGARNVSGDATGPILHRIDERFTREGLTFGIHNHWFPQKFAYESVEDILNGLSDLSKTCGSTLDVGQMAACGHDPVDAVRRLAAYLKVVHLKDVAGAGAEHNVLLGRGVARIADVVAELKKIRFTGLVAIEYEKEGDVDDDMRRNLEYARGLNDL
jgi:sugar phosphate isomerase/epimerase